VDEVLPRQPVRQRVLSLPFALRYLLATRPEVVTQVLGIVYRAISGHLICKAGLARASAVTGAVTLIQRFGSALNLNVHFHLLVLDGVYRREGEGRLRFVPVPAPHPAELQALVQRIAERIGRSLERSGLITRDIENAYLTFDPAEEAPINSLLGHRSRTGLRPAHERARRYLLCRRCRRSLTSRAGKWPRAPVSRCTRASARRRSNVTSSSTWRVTSQGRQWRLKGCR
jgi:hypothetical protein